MWRAIRACPLLVALLFLLSSLLPLYSRAAEKAVYRCVFTEEKVVAITFDDGPHPKTTDAILDLLAEYGAKATFFVIGQNLKLYGRATARAVEEGHEIGNHTYSHPVLSHVAEEALVREIEATGALIKAVTGVSPTLFRPPEGYYGGNVCRLAAEKDLAVVLWSIDTRDWAGVGTAEIVKNVMGNITPGSIVLFHDYDRRGQHTVSALKEILPRLSAAGYRFVTVSELLSYSASAEEPD